MDIFKKDNDKIKIHVKKNENFIKVDDNKIINKKCIIWVKKIEECLKICTKVTGCSLENGDTHKLCKVNNNDSYLFLNEWFK